VAQIICYARPAAAVAFQFFYFALAPRVSLASVSVARTFILIYRYFKKKKKK
jgi:hypothetical protein